MNQPIVNNIMDTARWVAWFRALETQRSDAHFKDPFAKVLAGEEGRRIAELMPHGQSGAWSMVVRTCLIDELIQKALESGVDTILNLAAGLDTRPYRMFLPGNLRWIEVDLPGILEHKSKVLEAVIPHCHYEMIKMDLSDVSARRELFVRISRQSKKVLVITEGLLIYLPEADVTGLARDLAAQPNFDFWITDIIRPLILRRAQRSYDQMLTKVGARMVFGPKDGPKFFESAGWGQSIFRSVVIEARRLNRRPRAANIKRLILNFMPERLREEIFNGAGVALLERQKQHQPTLSTKSSAQQKA